MALRLGEYILYGELRNKDNYSTHGALVLRSTAAEEHTTLRFELTGNPSPDLRGKVIRFWPGGADDDEEEEYDASILDLNHYKAVNLRQIGPTSDMTAEGWVRVLPCPVAEYLRRCDLGEPPPTDWARRFYLEWYGQNGRVVVELPGAIVEQQVRTPESGDDEGGWEELPNLAPPPDLAAANPIDSLDLSAITESGGEFKLEERLQDGPEDFERKGTLEREFDREAAAIDRAIRAGDPDYDDDDEVDPDMDEWLAETKLMDACLEKEGEPIVSLLEDVDNLPPPEVLNDAEVEARLKAVLAQLAVLGLSLDVCEHFTPRDCYRLLVETILPEQTAHKELIGTDWVTHISTWEDCPACEAEFEAKYEREFGKDAEE